LAVTFFGLVELGRERRAGRFAVLAVDGASRSTTTCGGSSGDTIRWTCSTTEPARRNPVEIVVAVAPVTTLPAGVRPIPETALAAFEYRGSSVLMPLARAPSPNSIRSRIGCLQSVG
jgi:hypothetical protein